MLNTKENRIRLYRNSITTYKGPITILTLLDKMETEGKEYECKLIFEGIKQHYEYEDKGVVLPKNYFKGVIDTIVTEVNKFGLMGTITEDQLEANLQELQTRIDGLIN